MENWLICPQHYIKKKYKKLEKKEREKTRKRQQSLADLGDKTITPSVACMWAFSQR